MGGGVCMGVSGRRRAGGGEWEEGCGRRGVVGGRVGGGRVGGGEWEEWNGRRGVGGVEWEEGFARV